MSIKNNHKLGKTIGFYGDSFCAAKYRKSPIKPGHDGHLGGNGWGGYPPDFKNYSQEQKLCFSYNVDQSLVAKPSDHEEYLNWWTHQLQKHFDKCIHYGVSGTSQEHMMYDQIDIHNERFNPNFAIPDVMICFWTFPGRIFFDHKELSMFDSDQMNFLNQIGSGTRYIGAKEKETIGITQKLMNIVKYNKLIFSTKLASNRSNALKVYFDNFCHMKLKERNPNVKIINIQIPQGDDDLNFKKQQLPLNNNLWIDNFSLDDLAMSYGDGEDNGENKYHLHLSTQKQHDFVYLKLKDWIENYDELSGIHDFSDWRSQFNIV